jgi:hydrogenase maturation protease
MATLRDQLQRHLTGRVGLVGVGNPDRADDAVGPWLAAAMRERGYRDVIMAARHPERWMQQLARGDFDTVVFLDAVEMRAAPGDAVFLDSAEIVVRYPQVSTHSLSLGTLARLIEETGRTRVFLLGVQPQIVGVGTDLSASVRTTAEILRDLLCERLVAGTEPLVVCGEQS